jgi:glycosyltransferase involved in cell wall biosynthesis
MRILHCLRAPIGGLFRHVLDLAAEQAARGHAVGILADSNAEDRLTKGKFAGIAPAMQLGIYRVPMSRQPGLGDYKAYKSVLTQARALSLDVLHGHGAKGGAYARLAARDLRKQGHRVKAFYTPHGGSLNFKPGTLPSRAFMQAERILERYGDGLIFESAYAANVYAGRVGRPHVPFRIIPNGLQPADFAPQTLDSNASDFLFVGELRQIKGIDNLLNALALIAKDRPATATIVGSGPQESELKNLANRLNLSERVSFPGAMPAAQAFALGRIMVVPSLAESFPYVVLEAAAAGLPLISTNVGGIPEIVAGTDTPLIAAGDPGVLAAAMRNALGQPADMAAKAARLRANVAAKFTVARMTSDVLEFYAAS